MYHDIQETEVYDKKISSRSDDGHGLANIPTSFIYDSICFMVYAINSIMHVINFVCVLLDKLFV
jgi:hypothetical protein